MKKELQEFLKELQHNQNINLEKGIENTVEINYVIERIEYIILNDDLLF